MQIEMKTGVVIFISDKTDFKTKNVERDKQGHYMILKVSVQVEDITIVNIYTYNIRASSINENIIMIGDFNTPLTSVDRSSREKINEIMALNATLDQFDLVDNS